MVEGAKNKLSNRKKGCTKLFSALIWQPNKTKEDKKMASVKKMERNKYRVSLCVNRRRATATITAKSEKDANAQAAVLEARFKETGRMDGKTQVEKNTLTSKAFPHPSTTTSVSQNGTRPENFFSYPIQRHGKLKTELFYWLSAGFLCNNSYRSNGPKSSVTLLRLTKKKRPCISFAEAYGRRKQK